MKRFEELEVLALFRVPGEKGIFMKVINVALTITEKINTVVMDDEGSGFVKGDLIFTYYETVVEQVQ